MTQWGDTGLRLSSTGIARPVITHAWVKLASLAAGHFIMVNHARLRGFI